MRVIYNFANRGALIGAKEPSIRIEGFVPEGVRTDGHMTGKMSLSEPIWHNIGNENDNVDTVQKFSNWQKHRETISNALNEAMATRTIRNRRVVLVERVLALENSVSASAAAEDNIQKTENLKIVPNISRNDERRGQSWAIIAIVGDPDYEKNRDVLISKLADEYVNYMETCTASNASDFPTDSFDKDNIIVSSYFGRDDLESLDSFFAYSKRDDIKAIKMLPNEPMVAFYGFSEDADALVERSGKLAALDSLKHADIAVVSMYSWLYLESWKRSKFIKRTSRDPKSEQFFKTMREALN